MQRWDLNEVDVAARRPEVLQSARGEGRAILVNLPAGEELQEHQVHERAYLLVVAGAIQVNDEEAAEGTLFVFEPNERHAVRAQSDARLLLILAPWPGPGHPGARDPA